MSFQQGLSGLNSAAKNLDVIGNNVANSNTVGFKQSTAQFSDVYANSLAGAGGLQVGIGTQVNAVQQNFSQGNINTSTNPLDMAINGGGFFRVSHGGAITYSRNGQFTLDKTGYIVNSEGERLTGYPANAAGGIVTSTPIDLQLSQADIAPKATANAGIVCNLDGRASTLSASAFDMNDTSTYNTSTSLSTYDSLGNPHTLSLYFLKTAANTWSVYGAQDGTAVGSGALGAVTFTSTGAIDTTATTLPFTVSAAVGGGAASPLAYTLDFTGSTQFGSAFGVNQLNQDGYTSGHLSGFSVGSDGVIQGRYTNGQTRAQGQVVLATFTNPNGLQPLGGNNWGESPQSGAAVVGSPGTGSLGLLQAGALEDSNVDLTAELVNMITAQRVYQANAQTIKTQDQVMQTLVNLR
ncbi:MAG TPA: flagellar hook protein FlgE [Burkholderiales bacterium]|nr:flagellar hook protein FlgE [Burkholderiales bacterium]